MYAGTNTSVYASNTSTGTGATIWTSNGLTRLTTLTVYFDCDCDGHIDDRYIDADGNNIRDYSQADLVASYASNSTNINYFLLKQRLVDALDALSNALDIYNVDPNGYYFQSNINNFKTLFDKVTFATTTLLKNSVGYNLTSRPTTETEKVSYYNNATAYFEVVQTLARETVRQITIGLESVIPPTGSFVQIKNREHFETMSMGGDLSTATFYSKYPGTYLNGVGIVIYGKGFTDTYITTTRDTNSLYTTPYPQWAKNTFDVFANYPDTTDQASQYGFSGDEIHVAIIDLTGSITGVKNQVLETYEGLSVAGDAKKSDGTTNYWASVINNKSQYIWVGDKDADLQFTPNSGLEWGTNFAGNTPAAFATLLGYEDPIGTAICTLVAGDVAGRNNQFNSSTAAVSARILEQYQTSFGDADESDISILVGYNTTIPSDLNSLVAIAENRKDSIAFVSACHSLDLIGGARADLLEGITDFVDAMGSSSYGAMDSGYKYQYDRFNNVYRYIPLCADSAGCAVRTDNQKDPWWSPAGYDRGRILNVVKLVFNPNKDERDILYKKNVNPVITSQGFGVILFGDKTLQKKPSAFDRINVRRLFNVLEKSIATAAKFQLFEFNDAFTRSQFKQLVEPFLREVQGKRGLTSYSVVCDESNNTPTVIDSNRFVADIFVAPNRSINFIQLNFVATPTGVSFAEYGG